MLNKAASGRLVRFGGRDMVVGNGCLAIKAALLGSLAVLMSASAVAAAVYRCGNVYTNQPQDASACTVVTGAQVSVVSAIASPTPPARPKPLVKSATSNPARVNDADAAQRATAALAVLRVELEQAQQRLAQAHVAARSGVDSLRAQQDQTRAQQDIASLQREMARWSAVRP